MSDRANLPLTQAEGCSQVQSSKRAKHLGEVPTESKGRY